MIDVADLLNNHASEIELPDIEMLRIALETGRYDPTTKGQLYRRLDEIYRELVAKEAGLDANEESPKPESEAPAPKQGPLTEGELRAKVTMRLGIMRVTASSISSGVKTLISSYADRTPVEVLCVCADLFTNDEFNSVLSWLQLGEAALTKYWAILDKHAVARYQLFSEDFFILHYNDLPANLVLRYGKNPWRKKDAMSGRLATFLKLKGVSL